MPSCTSIDDKILLLRLQGLVPSQTRSFTHEQDKSNLLTAEQLKEAKVTATPLKTNIKWSLNGLLLTTKTMWLRNKDLKLYKTRRRFCSVIKPFVRLHRGIKEDKDTRQLVTVNCHYIQKAVHSLIHFSLFLLFLIFINYVVHVCVSEARFWKVSTGFTIKTELSKSSWLTVSWTSTIDICLSKPHKASFDSNVYQTNKH